MKSARCCPGPDSRRVFANDRDVARPRAPGGHRIRGRPERSAVTGEDEPTGGFVFNRVLQPYVTKVLGRTVYDDMRRMESVVTSSDVDWTILRPSGLFELPNVTEYSLTEGHGPGRLTSRADLAAAMLRQLHDPRLIRKIGHVITTEDNPSLISMMWREARRK